MASFWRPCDSKRAFSFSNIDARALHIASNQINFNSIRLKTKRNVGKVKSLIEESNLYSTNGTCAIHWPRIMNERMHRQRLPEKSKSMERSKVIGSIERIGTASKPPKIRENIESLSST